MKFKLWQYNYDNDQLQSTRAGRVATLAPESDSVCDNSRVSVAFVIALLAVQARQFVELSGLRGHLWTSLASALGLQGSHHLASCEYDPEAN